MFDLLLLVVAVFIFLKQINMAITSSCLVVNSVCALCIDTVLPLRENLLAWKNMDVKKNVSKKSKSQ